MKGMYDLVFYYIIQDKMNTYLMVFLIILIGYLIGRIDIKGISLGTSGVLLVALVFGHFGFVAPDIIKNLGLVCFVAAVGIIAGPVFFKNFKKGALQYVILGIITILVGGVFCVFSIKTLHIPTALAVGLLNGALTSTPGLAAALEATGDSMSSIGYGIAYPFGVVGVVLFVQLVPRILKTDIAGEMQEMQKLAKEADDTLCAPLQIEQTGFFAYAVVVVLGVLLGNVSVPLGNASFSLGTSGGPLISGLLVGHFGHIGKISLHPPKNTMNVMREFGLVLFLLGAGTEAGQGFVEVVKEYGFSLFLIGAGMTLLPMIVVIVVARRMLYMTTMNSLGSICGGMTSTPALGTLISVVGTDAVAVSYASTYPIALIVVVLSTQFIALFCR